MEQHSAAVRILVARMVWDVVRVEWEGSSSVATILMKGWSSWILLVVEKTV